MTIKIYDHKRSLIAPFSSKEARLPIKRPSRKLFSVEVWMRFAKLSRTCYGELTTLETMSVANSEKEWPVFCATALIFCTTSSLSSTSMRLGNSLGSRRGEALLRPGAIGNYSLWRCSIALVGGCERWSNCELDTGLFK